MKKLLEGIKIKGKKTTILGGLIMALGALVAYMGQDIENDAEKGLLMLDNAKFGEAKLK